MPKYRDYIQESRIDIGTSGTKTYNLDYADPITQLDLYFEATNGGSGNVASPFERCISKIEIVDGGKVLWDLPGEVAQAAYVHDQNKYPYAEIEESQSGSVRQQMPILFGRKLFDPDFAFNPRNFKNPQLKFTFDEATINTAGATGYSSDTWTFTLGVRLMEGHTDPGKFLSYRTVESFTSAGTGARRVEMPVDRTLRYLLCRAYESGTALYTSITNHKLSEDGGKFIPFDLPTRDMINRMCESFDPVTRRAVHFVTTGDVKATFVGVPLNGHVTDDTNGCFASANFYIDGRVLIYMVSHSGAAGDPGHVYVSNEGWAHHNTLIYPFGDRQRPEQWYTPPVNGKLDYYVTDGDADADVDICVQQVYQV